MRQAVQVSPAAIKQYYAGHPDLNNKGLTVASMPFAFRALRTATIAKAQELKSGIQSLGDFKKLAAERSVPRGGIADWCTRMINASSATKLPRKFS